MSTKAWLAVTTTILVLALGALGHVQLFWLNQLSHAQLERERSVLDFAARQIAVDLEHDVHRLAMEFQGAAPYEVDEHLARWRASARDPHIVRDAYIVRGDELMSLETRPPSPIEWPQDLAAVRDSVQAHQRRDSPFYATVPALLIPLRPAPPPPRRDEMPDGPPQREEMPHGPPMHEPQPQPGMGGGPPSVLIRFDRAYLASTYFPEIVHRLGETYDVVVTDGANVVYSNAQWDGSKPDATAKFLRFFHDDEESSGWTVLLRRHGTGITEAIHRIRMHNFALGGLLLALLAASFVVLAMIAHRAERLRVQQLELVAGLTHELNTPLAAIRSAGQNLADGVVTDPERVARYGSVVNREAKRLGDLVAQVLDYSGLQTNSAPRRERVDIRAIVHDAIEQTRWLAEEKGVAIEERIASDLPATDGDADALTRAVQNLVANAIRHGGEGKWVGVRVERDGSDVALTVEDRGPGIDRRDGKRLFEPCYRGANAKARGTGLGLTIVRQIAQAHGGSISVDAQRARGAAFTLRIPGATNV